MPWPARVARPDRPAYSAGRSCRPAVGRPCAWRRLLSQQGRRLHTPGLACEARLHPAPVTPPRCTAHWAVRPAASSMRNRSPLSCAGCAAAAIGCQLPSQGGRPPRSAGRTQSFWLAGGGAVVLWPSRPDCPAYSAGRSCGPPPAGRAPAATARAPHTAGLACEARLHPAVGRPCACWRRRSAGCTLPAWLAKHPTARRKPALHAGAVVRTVHMQTPVCMVSHCVASAYPLRRVSQGLSLLATK